MLYALITPEETIDYTHDFPDGFNIPNTKEGWRWIPVETEPRPSYNPELQTVYQTDTIEPARVLREWHIRDKDAGQLEGEKIQKINSVDPVVMIALHDLFNLVGANTTLQEYKDRLKGLI